MGRPLKYPGFGGKSKDMYRIANKSVFVPVIVNEDTPGAQKSFEMTYETSGENCMENARKDSVCCCCCDARARVCGVLCSWDVVLNLASRNVLAT